jgi:hypothetical protein
MKELIRTFNFTKETTQLEIEETLLGVEDFTSTYYSIKSMKCKSYPDAAKEIYNYLQSL